MFDYVYTDHAQYTIKTYAKMALFPLTGYGTVQRYVYYPGSTGHSFPRPRTLDRLDTGRTRISSQ